MLISSSFPTTLKLQQLSLVCTQGSLEEVGVNVPIFLAYYEETHFNGGGHYQAIEPVQSSAMLEDVRTRFGHDVAWTLFLPDQGFE